MISADAPQTVQSVVVCLDADVTSAGWSDDGQDESSLSNNEALAAETAHAAYGSGGATLSLLTTMTSFAFGAIGAGVLVGAGSLFSGLPTWSGLIDGAPSVGDKLELPMIVTDPGGGVSGQGASAGERPATPSSPDPRIPSTQTNLRIMVLPVIP